MGICTQSHPPFNQSIMTYSVPRGRSASRGSESGGRVVSGSAAVGNRSFHRRSRQREGGRGGSRVWGRRENRFAAERRGKPLLGTAKRAVSEPSATVNAMPRSARPPRGWIGRERHFVFHTPPLSDSRRLASRGHSWTVDNGTHAGFENDA